jgi:hypothetical protein
MRRAPSKYRAVPTVVDGIRFHSKREAARYVELKLLERVGEIQGLGVQPGFPLCAPTKGDHLPSTIGNYFADFIYRTRDGKTVIEDVKGMRTPLYKWKKKHCETQYGIEIREV